MKRFIYTYKVTENFKKRYFKTSVPKIPYGIQNDFTSGLSRSRV